MVDRSRIKLLAASILSGTATLPNPTEASNTEPRQFVRIEDFGGRSGDARLSITNDSAIRRAMAWASSLRLATINFDSGVYFFEKPWPTIEAPISIQGQGNSQTYLQWSADAEGALVSARNLGFGAEDQALVQEGDRAFAAIQQISFGLNIRGLTICGDRRKKRVQHGLVLAGNIDFADIDLDILYVNGHALWAGKSFNGIRGNLRESRVRIRTRSCGSSDGTSSVRLELADSPRNPTEDSINLIKELQIDCVFPYGKGIEFVDSRRTLDGPPLYGVTGTVMLHGRTRGKPSDYPLLSFVGAITNIELSVNIAYSNADVPDIFFGGNDDNQAYPSSIDLRVRQPNSRRGVHMERARNIQIAWLYAFVRKELFSLGSDPIGPVSLNVNSDNVYQIVPHDVQLDGVRAVQISGWSASSTENLLSFFPTGSSSGDGDSLRCSAHGVLGVLRRIGSVLEQTDRYTFTPDQPSYEVLLAGSHFSKLLIPTQHLGLVSGRPHFSRRFKEGVSVDSHWTSKNLLRAGRWSFWCDSDTGLLRQGPGFPTSNSSGFSYGTWREKTADDAGSPEVSGVSLLHLKYPTPTELRTLKGGQGGQRLTVVSLNNNCTLKHSDSLRLKNKSFYLLKPEDAVELVYSSEIKAWIQTA